MPIMAYYQQLLKNIWKIISIVYSGNSHKQQIYAYKCLIYANMCMICFKISKNEQYYEWQYARRCLIYANIGKFSETF